MAEWSGNTDNIDYTYSASSIKNGKFELIGTMQNGDIELLD